MFTVAQSFNLNSSPAIHQAVENELDSRELLLGEREPQDAR